MSEPTTAPADAPDAIVGEVALPHITENGVGVWADEDDNVHYGDPTSPGFLAAKQRADDATSAEASTEPSADETTATSTTPDVPATDSSTPAPEPVTPTGDDNTSSSRRRGR